MPPLSVGTLLFQLYALLCWFVQFSACCMHYSVGWHINSVCCTHHFVGWCITLSSVRSSLSVDTVLCRLYALHWWLVYYSVSCTHLATLSVWHFTLLVEHITLLVGRITLSVVHTTLSVLNIYHLGCMHYSASCQHVPCRLYALLCQL